MINYEQLIPIAIKAALAGGKEIMALYGSNDIGVEEKEDHSPVTRADKNSSKAIVSVLNQTNTPIICEEEAIPSFPVRSKWKTLWMVDPLDGTKEFIKENGEFSICIAYIENNQPIFGVIYIPTTDELFYGGAAVGSFRLFGNKFSAAFKIADGEKLPLNSTTDSFVVTGSRSHGNKETDDYFKQLRVKHTNIKFLKVGSAIKFCRLAEGKVDLYPRFQLCMEWDTAAGHALLNGVNKTVTETETNKPLVYNKENLYSPFFIAE